MFIYLDSITVKSFNNSYQLVIGYNMKISISLSYFNMCTPSLCCIESLCSWWLLVNEMLS